MPTFLPPVRKRFTGRRLVSGEDLGGNVVDANAAGDRLGNRFRVSGNHRHPDPELM